MISKQPTEVVNAPEGVEVHASGVDKLTLGDESVGQRLHNNVVNFIDYDDALTIGVVHSAADRINSALGGNEE